MQHKLHAEISITITATQEEWDFITKEAKVHYDAIVRAMVTSSDWDGYGFMTLFNKQRKILNNEEPILYKEFTNRQAQTLLKAIEFSIENEAVSLRKELSTAIQDGIQQSELINNNLNK